LEPDNPSAMTSAARPFNNCFGFRAPDAEARRRGLDAGWGGSKCGE